MQDDVQHAVQVLERALLNSPAKMPQMSSALWNYVIANQTPQKEKSNDLTPGAPIEPYKGIIPAQGPRQYAYQIGSNISGIDRSEGRDNIPSFDELRNLARLYSGIGMCERVILDMIPRLVPQVRLKPHLIAKGHRESEFQKEIAVYLKFFEKPDRINDIHTWLRTAWRESTQIDALSIYKHPNRGGGLYALEILDGSTIKPLKDERGMPPRPPYPAFQQYVYGVPGPLLSAKELIYYRETPQTDSMFGFSRVERIIIEVNQALRKKAKDLARYTEGNIPAGIMQVPAGAGWTPDMIDAYEQAWNSLIAGNAQQQIRVKFTQPGFEYQPTDEQEITTVLDMLTLNITVGCYGLSMADLGFTENIHKSNDEGQQDMMFRRTLYPFTAQYASMFTSILQEEFDEDRFYFTFGGFEEAEDLKTMADAYSELIQWGVASPATIANLMKLPEIPETGPFILTKQGNMLFMRDYTENSPMRKLQEQAQAAGLQAQTTMSQQAQQQGVTGNVTGAQQTKAGKTGSGSISPNSGVASGSIPKPGTNTTGSAPTPPQAAAARVINTEPRATDVLTDQSALSAEYRRWREIALKEVKAGRAVRSFASDIIPQDEHGRIAGVLRFCQTPDEVRAVFSCAKERTLSSSQWNDLQIARSLSDLQKRGVTHLKWKAHAGCTDCARNDGVIRRIGQAFPTGALLPPSSTCHNCGCEYEELSNCDQQIA